MFKRVTFFVSLVFALVAMMILAIPFGAQDDGGEIEPVPTATPLVESFGSGGVEISFWNGLTGSDGVTMNAMLSDFVAGNPDVSVTTEIVEWNTLYAKLQAAFVAGNPPDVFLLHSAEVPQFASFGVLKDLGSWYSTDGGWFPVDDISDVTFSGMQYEEVVYGVPLDNHGRGLWINVDMFEAAGLDPNMEPPADYEGWVNLFQQLTIDENGNNALSEDFDAEHVVQWGYSVQEWPRVNFIANLAQHGGQFISDDGTTIEVNSEAGVAALQKTYDLVYTYNVSPPPAGFDAWQAFSSGSLAIVPTGSWFRNFAEDQTDINSMAWPQWQFGPEQATYVGIHTFMVPVGLEGEKLEAVQTMIQWISENQVDWAASGQVPARVSAQEALDPDNYPSNILLGQTFGEYGVLDVNSTVVQELYAALDPELDAALNNLKTPEEALNDAAERMQAILDRS